MKFKIPAGFGLVVALASFGGGWLAATTKTNAVKQ